jgi:cyclopropane-fatty-acyl-phospholipid synthase
MLYKFKSKATADLIMLEANGKQILRIIGKEPAPKGIVEVAEMPEAIEALRRAVQQEEDALAQMKAQKAQRYRRSKKPHYGPRATRQFEATCHPIYRDAATRAQGWQRCGLGRIRCKWHTPMKRSHPMWC